MTRWVIVASFLGLAIAAMIGLTIRALVTPAGTPAPVDGRVPPTPATAPPTSGPGPLVGTPAPAPTPTAAPLPLLAGTGADRAIYVDGAGRFFALRTTPDGISLTGVYALRYDRARFANDPARRSASGFYFDDLAAENETALARAKEAFLREVRSEAVDIEANARAEARARDILALGDAAFLVEVLRDRRYSTRRAAAFALGEAGWKEARSVLEEVLDERSGDGAERARRVLAGLGARTGERR